MHYCSSFVSFMRAIITFEEPLLEKSQKELESTEKLCSDQTKMFKGLKKAFGMSSSTSATTITNLDENINSLISPHREPSLEEKFTKAIIIADCKLYLALLTFIRQDVASYLSSGLLQIRRSWKAYSRIQKQLFELYKRLEPNAEELYGSSGCVTIWHDDNEDSEAGKSTAAQELQDLTIGDDELSNTGISVEAVKRLLGAVSFGYGVFQICLSFMPPSALKLIKILGFEGDRALAIRAIKFTSMN